MPLTIEAWRPAGGELGPESELLLQSTEQNKVLTMKFLLKTSIYSKICGLWGGVGGGHQFIFVLHKILLNEMYKPHRKSEVNTSPKLWARLFRVLQTAR